MSSGARAPYGWPTGGESLTKKQLLLNWLRPHMIRLTHCTGHTGLDTAPGLVPAKEFLQLAKIESRPVSENLLAKSLVSNSGPQARDVPHVFTFGPRGKTKSIICDIHRRASKEYHCLTGLMLLFYFSKRLKFKTEANSMNICFCHIQVEEKPVWV